VLEVLADEGELSLSEISRRVALSPSTVARALDTLRQRGYVFESAATGLYRMGVRTFEVGSSFISQTQLHQVARPLMQALVDEVQDTATLAVLEGSESVHVDQVVGQYLVRRFNGIGKRTPLHSTSSGKVLLAWQPEERVRALLGDAPLVRYTLNTLPDTDAVLRELANVRRLGYSVDNEERELGVRCLAAPVRDHTDEVIASLSLSTTSARLPDGRLAELAVPLLRTSGEISRQLGSGRRDGRWGERTSDGPVA
jgi:DNA-binding IclR family transcriptional regulator